MEMLKVPLGRGQVRTASLLPRVSTNDFRKATTAYSIKFLYYFTCLWDWHSL